ncbi:uncharacterized protein LOC108910590 [Anoplophora glabripennis]|uniref:uncharacterized protein LOC108910590 n=1 Tax=Anoplophora glabripennis TaxID=217634 RepID=UPI000874B6C4|nr:uncharacterized protein LOC108910590 [Anoplophora glabripennis]
MQPAYMKNAPSDFVGVAHESGWMTSDNFIKYLEHFIRYTRPSEDSRILLLMDNNASHLTLEAVNLCRENFITLVGFPPHTSHRLQPLDVSLYGPLKTVYSRAKAYLKVASVANAKSGFRATGIEPFDPDIFTALDFVTAKTTEIEQNTADKHLEASLNVETKTQEQRLKENEAGISTPMKTQPIASTSKSTSPKEVFGLPPLPRGSQKNRRPRKKLPSLVISSTPVKNALQAKNDEKIEKERKKKLREQAKIDKKKCKLETSAETAYADTDDDMDLEFEEDDKLCIICSDMGKDNELWFQCSKCRGWAHSQCTTLNPKETKAKT